MEGLVMLHLLTIAGWVVRDATWSHLIMTIHRSDHGRIQQRMGARGPQNFESRVQNQNRRAMCQTWGYQRTIQIPQIHIILTKIGKQAPLCEHNLVIDNTGTRCSRWSSRHHELQKPKEVCLHLDRIWTSHLCCQWVNIRREGRIPNPLTRQFWAQIWPQVAFRNLKWIKVKYWASQVLTVAKNKITWTLSAKQSTTTPSFQLAPWFPPAVVAQDPVMEMTQLRSRWWGRGTCWNSWNEISWWYSSNCFRMKKWCNREWLIWLKKKLALRRK